ncbi:MAG: hypothetical protein V5A44_06780 [Haloarculaceae archaeon]
MSVDFSKRRNVGIALGLVVATIVLVYFGTGYLRTTHGWNLVGEMAYAFLILVLALLVYDNLLVR